MAMIDTNKGIYKLIGSKVTVTMVAGSAIAYDGELVGIYDGFLELAVGGRVCCIALSKIVCVEEA